MNDRTISYNAESYRKALKNRNMTKYYDICQATSISPGTASALYYGSCKVSTKTICNLKNGLLLSLEELAEIFPALYGGL